MVAKDRKALPGDGTRGDVENCRRQLTGDLVHIRNHQQQALRRSKGGGECASLQCAMDGAGCTTLALHFDYGGDRAPNVGLVGGRPLVRPLAHSRRRCNGIDCYYFVNLMSYIGGSFISVESDLNSLIRHAPTSGARDRPA